MNEWDSLMFVIRTFDPPTPEDAAAILRALARHAAEIHKPPKMATQMVKTLWEVAQREAQK